MSDETGKSEEQRSPALKAAEWVTMGLSLVLVLGVAGALAYEATQEGDAFIAAEVRILGDEAQQKGEKFIVPIEVRNNGRLTMKDLKVEVTYESAEGKQESSDFLIDYLGGRAKERVYLFFDGRPGELKARAEPVAYQTE